MRNFNFNISSLFSGFGSGSGFGTFNFSDYASIKNGSYGKLMKSYYSEQKKATSDKSSTNSTINKNKKEQAVDKTGFTQLKKEADSLKESVEKLSDADMWKQTDGKYDTKKITDAVKTFVNEYNDTLTQAGKVTSKEVSQDVGYMSSMTKTMSKVLSKTGITVGTDGKLSINEEEFKKADITTLKSLFSGVASYGSQMGDKAGNIARDALMNSSIYGSNGSLSSTAFGMFNKWI